MSSRELVVANPITVAPEAMPAFSPLKESSNTDVVSGVVPKTSIQMCIRDRFYAPDGKLLQSLDVTELGGEIYPGLFFND